jgi:hypothetical protein
MTELEVVKQIAGRIRAKDEARKKEEERKAKKEEASRQRDMSLRNEVKRALETTGLWNLPLGPFKTLDSEVFHGNRIDFLYHDDQDEPVLLLSFDLADDGERSYLVHDGDEVSLPVALGILADICERES